MQLSEKYRPQEFATVIGQEKAIKRIRAKGRNGMGGIAWYISGKSGQGKTTLARIIAGNIAEGLYITEIVARQLTTKTLSEYVRNWNYIPMQGTGHALIVNESHGLNKAVIECLLDVLENLPDNVTVIFTTTLEGDTLFEEQIDSSPFASRCCEIRLEQRTGKEYIGKCMEIADKEGLSGKDEKAFSKAWGSCGANMRKMIDLIDSGEFVA